MSVSFPGLPLSSSMRLTKEYSNLAIPVLSEIASTSSEESFFYPTAISRSPESQLRQIRCSCVAIASDFGFPRSRPSRNFSKFDQLTSVSIFTEMRAIPADAARDEVWSFLSLILLPDVAHWRFPNKHQKPDYDRIIGRPRNVFRRLWWRAYCLGPELSAQLYEDEAVAIMERPTFGGNPLIASAIASYHIAIVASVPGLRRTDFLRQVMKRLSRLAPIVGFSDAPALIMQQQVYETFLKALHQLGYRFEERTIRSAVEALRANGSADL